MSCPLGYKPKAKAKVDLKQLPKEYINVMAAFESLLPNCEALSSKLDQCRERVALNSGKGHCLDQSREWMGCFNRRNQCSRLIIDSCSGNGLEKSGGISDQMQQEYIQCCEDNGNDQSVCMAPLKEFLHCATQAVSES